MTQLAQFIKGNPQYGDYTPGADVSAGDVVVRGDTLLICTGGVKTNGAGTGISSGREGAMAVRGGWFQVIAAMAIGKGKMIYWDAAAGKVTLNSKGNLRFGYNGDVAAAADGDVIVAEFNPAIVSVDQPTLTVAATGSVQGDAAALSLGFNEVTGADATKGVILPVPNDGDTVIVDNSDAANAILKVYPSTGLAINALAANGAISMAAKTSATFTYYATGSKWVTTPKVPS